MSFWQHLEALRWVLMRIVIVYFILVGICFAAMPHIFNSVILGPTSSDFILYRWLSGLGGDGTFFPDFSGEFKVDIINVKLYDGEKRSVLALLFFGVPMFYLGCATGYFIVFPFTFRFLAQYQLSEDISNMISLNSYIDNFTMLIFVMGIVFELPFVTWILSRMGLVTAAFLRQYRRHAVVVLLVLAAIITPTGDPFTLMVVFVPLFLLYELSILLARRKTDEEEEEEETSLTQSA